MKLAPARKLFELGTGQVAAGPARPRAGSTIRLNDGLSPHASHSLASSGASIEHTTPSARSLSSPDRRDPAPATVRGQHGWPPAFDKRICLRCSVQLSGPAQHATYAEAAQTAYRSRCQQWSSHSRCGRQRSAGYTRGERATIGGAIDSTGRIGSGVI